ncbi:enoyl-CoA hydratase/isomerase family protein [Novispirillum itersonii]|uniref:3-hydroxyisobutyryl-CoA hydrolase n=1 Tax=Novispirillum itersonii TaxID=189 RepID=A0A7X0DLJ9_NOVIT|nr:enoyl-CoA hydratase/isomerase family protein [Novispirillum itersonii]MBB6210075.1 enoyl-CoA hydratase [Novispirillum itersonii]
MSSVETADEILSSVTNGVARVTLNRPKALNALTLDGVRAMDPLLRRLAADHAVSVVVVEGAGEKAFCAGGDIRRMWEANRAGDVAYLRAFFGEEYRLNRLIKVYGKPYVALMDGVTMGGGVGLSVHGSHRVATERTLFAMPETAIGLFPDVGGTWFLPRLPGAIGMYMALTGARLKAADCLYTGVATHYVPAEKQEALIAALQGVSGSAAVTAVLDQFHQDPGPAPLADQRAAIDRCFSKDSVEAIVSALQEEGGEWADKTLHLLGKMSPSSLKITFAQIRKGAALETFDEAMQLEYRVSPRIGMTADLAEGVRAVIIDKDHAPKWSPSALADVDPAVVEGFFAPADAGELTFA